LPLRHLLGPSAASPSEIASIAAKLGPGAIQLLVKNYINENGYKEWESDPRFAETLQDRAAVLTIPRLEAEVCTSVQRAGVAFGAHHPVVVADPGRICLHLAARGVCRLRRRRHR